MLANWGRAMMDRTTLPLKLLYLLFKQVLKTMFLDGLNVETIDGIAKTRIVHW
jgi:hypothetical protein